MEPLELPVDVAEFLRSLNDHGVETSSGEDHALDLPAPLPDAQI